MTKYRIVKVKDPRVQAAYFRVDELEEVAVLEDFNPRSPGSTVRAHYYQDVWEPWERTFNTSMEAELYIKAIQEPITEEIVKEIEL